MKTFLYNLSENASKDYLEFRKRHEIVKDALHSPALCRTFFLLIDSKKSERNNKDLSEKYYDTSNSSKLSNPKVMAIYLRKLREACIIKRIEKVGKTQLYDVDWNGILEILLYYDEGRYDTRFDVSHLFGFDIVNLDDKGEEISTPQMESYLEAGEKRKVLQEFITKFLKPFILKYVEFQKTIVQIDEYTSMSNPETLKEYGYTTKNFEQIEYDIHNVLKKFESILLDDIPITFRDEITDIMTKTENIVDSRLLQLLFAHFKLYVYSRIEGKKHDYYQSKFIEFHILKDFNKELKKIDKEIYQLDYDEIFSELSNDEEEEK